MSATRRELSVTDVYCPLCLVRAGEPCVTASSHPYGTSHAERVRLFAKRTGLK